MLRSTDQRYFKRIFSPKRKDKGCTKPNNEELREFYFSLNIIKMKRDDDGLGHVERKKRNVYRVLVRKPDGRRPLTRCRCIWEENIKTNLKEI